MAGEEPEERFDEGGCEDGAQREGKGRDGAGKESAAWWWRGRYECDDTVFSVCARQSEMDGGRCTFAVSVRGVWLERRETRC